MSKLYCQKCGSLNEGISINFCQKCGNSFNVISATKKNKSIKIDNEDEDEITEVPQLTKLEIEPIQAKRQRVTLKDVFEGGISEGIIRDPVKPLGKEEFLEQWQKEAGPRKGSSEIGGGGE